MYQIGYTLYYVYNFKSFENFIMYTYLHICVQGLFFLWRNCTLSTCYTTLCMPCYITNTQVAVAVRIFDGMRIECDGYNCIYFLVERDIKFSFMKYFHSLLVLKRRLFLFLVL